MSESYECIKCNKSFLTKNSLICHINRSKNHKKEEKNTCEYCQKDFEFPYLLKKHDEHCIHKYIILRNKALEELKIKSEIQIEQQNIIEELKLTNESYINQIKELKIKSELDTNQIEELKIKSNSYDSLSIEHKELIQTSRNYRQRLDEKTSQYNKIDKEYRDMEKKMKELQTNFLLMENSCKHYKEFYDKHTQKIQPVNNNNITIDQRSISNNIQADIINIANSFEPLTPEFVYEQMKDISQKNLANYGAEYIATHALNSKIGINMLITDVSRRISSYINKNNQLVKDSYCTELIKLIINETSKSENVKKALELAISYIDDVAGTEDYNKVAKHIQEITRLSKNDPEYALYDTVSIKMSKHGATKQSIDEKQKSYIENQINKAQTQTLPPGVTLKDTLPIDTHFKPAEGTIDYQVIKLITHM